VPYWALPAADIARIFIGGPGSPTFISRFSQLVTDARRRFAEDAEWLTLDSAAVTADTPIPFDIKPIWHRIDYENRETRTSKADASTVRLIEEGNAAALESARFEPYGAAGQPPHQGPLYNSYGTSPDLLRLGLLDPRLRFFLEPQGNPRGSDPLVTV